MLERCWAPAEVFFRLGTFKSWCYKTKFLNIYKNFNDPSASRTLHGGTKSQFCPAVAKNVVGQEISLYVECGLQVGVEFDNISGSCMSFTFQIYSYMQK